MNREQIIQMRLDGMSAQQIADELVVPKARINKFVSAEKIEAEWRRRRDKRLKAIIKPMIMRGMTGTEISEATGMATSTISHLRKRLGLLFLSNNTKAQNKPKKPETQPPAKPRFDLNIEDDDLSESEKHARITAWGALAAMAVSRRYRDVSRGLDRGAMVIRATAPCGARAMFTINDSIPACGSKGCPCNGRFRGRG